MQKNFVQNIEEYCVDIEAPFINLLDVLNKKFNSDFGSGFALVTKDNVLVGVIEDSDLRKFLLKNPTEKLTISKLVNTNFIFIEAGLNKNEIIDRVITQINSRGWNTFLPVKVIPVILNGKPIDLLDLSEYEIEISQIIDNNIIIGLGYVGLTLALSLSSIGRTVFGFDTDSNKIENLKKGKSQITEPGIDKLLSNCLDINFFPVSSFDTLPFKSGLRNFYYICVGTPLKTANKIDLGPINDVIKMLMPILKEGDAIIMRSTVPVGTGSTLISLIESQNNWKIGVHFNYISAPERTVEGDALREIKELPQIIGGATKSCLLLASKVFQGLSLSVTPVNNLETAELAKIIGNAYRDYIFGFSNSLIDICQSFNIDINHLINTSNRGYPRSNIPLPSPGVGGPCLTKDSFFLDLTPLDSKNSPVIKARQINQEVPTKSIEFISSVVKDLKRFSCLCIGLAFKGVPETNDIRDSTSITYYNLLKRKVEKVDVWDAVVDLENEAPNFSHYNPNFEYNFFALLNNHPNNTHFLKSKLQNTLEEQIIIFDPWRLFNIEVANFADCLKEIEYFSLSHYQKFVI